ncbi:CHC2 zinc finger domain-containing protein [Bradyrhizobium sp.]|uniref:CHC2 zinc finger domain-containing protein n=1 Tax=Bradyrhizobium sp. TaxID=376 RepID=UPI0039E5154A
MAIDVDTLLDSVDIADIVGRYIKLDRGGSANEYTALCPFHSEKSASFTVNTAKGFYHCFGCGAHGDAIRFVREITGAGFKEACERISNGYVPQASEIRPREHKPEKEEAKEWQAIMPIPEDVPPLPRTHSAKKKGEWVSCDWAGDYAYHDQSGALLGYVQRYEYEQDGNRAKEYVPHLWCRNAVTGECDWRKTAFPKPRPLYNLHRLAASPDAIVIVCEGEKKADAVMRMLPEFVGVSWSGGSNAIKHMAWQALSGRKVLLWPDADDVGMQAVDGGADKHGVRKPGVAELLDDIALAVKIVVPPEGVPQGWDLADAESEGWDGDRVIEHINAFARLPSHKTQAPPPAPIDHDEPPQHDDGYHGEPEDLSHDDGEQLPYRALGYDHGRYFYLAGRAAQVIELSAGSHTKLNMMSIAPWHFWKREYHAKKESEGADWEMAANALMRQCEDAGVYDAEKVRGRGAWWDGDRALLHLGGALIVDGERVPLTHPGIKNIYEAAPPLHMDISNGLTNRDAAELVSLCRMLQWEKPISATLLAGWIFLAPICGALGWRPHIWITGGAGTGKTWVQSEIVARILGNTAILPQSNTTEAGIRQLLGIDARPVVFDEAESQDMRAAERIQGIMFLARQASSESGGAIIKGTTGGKAMMFRVRSMFAFSSIGVGVQQYADQTRVTVLGMQVDEAKSRDQRAAEFVQIERRAVELLTPEYCAGMRARAVNMIGAVRANAKTFATAGAEVIGTQRLGDQIGTLLAGAYALHSNGLISPEQAREWIAKQDWSEETALTESKDEAACLARILEHTVRVQGDMGHTSERSIGELISRALRQGYDGDIGRGAAEETLLRIGVKIDGQGFKVANTHSALEKILAGTPWAGKQHGRILKRLSGAKVHETERYGSGGTHRGVWLPASSVLDRA